MQLKGKKITAFVLAFALVLSSVGTIFASARTTNAYEDIEHANVDFGDMKYVRYDISELKTITDEMESLISKEGNEDAVIAQYDLIVSQADKAYSLNALAFIHSYIDCTSEYWQTETSAMTTIWTGVYKLAMTTICDVMKSDYADVLAEKIGYNNASLFYNYVPSSDESDVLTTEFQSLQQSYLNISTSVTDYESFNKESGEILLKIIDNRNAYAKQYGFDNYAQLEYYINDFSQADMNEFRQAVKDYIVPAVSLLIDSIDESEFTKIKQQAEKEYTQNDVIDILGKYVGDISSELKESYDYMLKYHLYDISDNENKIDAGFTTDLLEYNEPFLYYKSNSTYLDITSIVHEFGHFNSFYHDFTNVLTDSSSIDVCEVSSQALEMLFFDYYDEIYGDVGQTMAKESMLGTLIYSVLAGCLYDEFQYVIYTSDDILTSDDLNNTFGKLAEEYGMSQYFDATTWVEVPHTFTQPFYYISYATSAISAIDIWQLSVSDMDSAVDKYLEVTKLQQNMTFSDAMLQAGIDDVFEESTIKKIADTIVGSYAYSSELSGSFSDINYSDWYYNAVKFVSENSIMGGAGNGIFEPQSAITRAMLVSVLSRIDNADLTTYTNTFNDVENGSWYEKSVAWANANDVAKGVGDGNFAPNASITREQICVMLIKYAISKGYIDSGIVAEPDFSDSESISEWAKEYVGIAQSYGIVSGENGCFYPTRTATRAEIAVMMQAFVNFVATEHSTRTEVIDCSESRFALSSRSGTTEGWSWNYLTKTLYINNLTVDAGENYGIVLPEGATLCVNGNNTISGSCGLLLIGSVNIIGSGSLNIVGDNYGIYACADTNITDCKLNITSGQSGIYSEGNITFKDVKNAQISGDIYGLLIIDSNLLFENCDMTFKTSDYAAILSVHSDLETYITFDGCHISTPQNAKVMPLVDGFFIDESLNGKAISAKVKVTDTAISDAEQIASYVVISTK